MKFFYMGKRVLLQGLQPSDSTFLTGESLFNTYLKKLVLYFFFFNDILAFSKCSNDHLKHLRVILEVLLTKTFYFYFLISKKEIYIQKTTLCKKSIRQTKDYIERKKIEKTKNKLITNERIKEQRERITRSESPSPRPIIKRTTERSKQLVSRTFHLLKSPPITLPPNTPH